MLLYTVQLVADCSPLLPPPVPGELAFLVRLIGAAVRGGVVPGNRGHRLQVDAPTQTLAETPAILIKGCH